MSESTDPTIEITMHLARGRRGRKQASVGPKPADPAPTPGRTPRLTRLMALAVRFELLIRDGEIADYAEIARLGHITRARVTQIMNLLLLAPDIQEEILSFPRVQRGRDAVTERDMRPITTTIDWRKQRSMWREMLLTSFPAP
jgi:hypothetical protein